MDNNTIHTTGRRKTSVARIYFSKKKGKVLINNKDYKTYFSTDMLQYKIQQPFLLLDDSITKYDIKVNVVGGGVTGQAEAIRLAVSKALCEIDEKNKEILKEESLLTRDSRMVERKKYGRKKARKKFQFSKR